MLLWVLFYVLLFIPLFFFACYTTPRRTSFHSTFWTYLPFCASYKYLGCLSLSLLLTWDDFACQLACKWLCRCCWPAKVLYEMREVPRKSGKKSRCCCRCCLKPTHKAKQNKVQPNNKKSSDQTRPEIAAAQRRADPQPHTIALAAAYNADDWGALARDQTTRWRRDVNTLELAVGWGWQSDDDADADVGLWAAASTTCVRLTGWPNCGAPWENPKIIVAHVEALG